MAHKTFEQKIQEIKLKSSLENLSQQASSHV